MSAPEKNFADRPSRRRSLPALLSLAVLVPAVGLAGCLNSGPIAVAQETIEFPSQNGSVSVRSVRQMSVGISTAAGAIVTDPTGSASSYAAFGTPELILVSHEHDEHFDPDTLEDLAGPDTRIIVPPYVMERLPAALRDRAISLPNGDSAELGRFTVEAVAAYGLGGQAAQWHPQGRGNSYLVSLEGQRLFIAGSTEAVPEMLELRDVDLALLPLYPPYALGPEDAVRAISIMQPGAVYIYQYDSTRTRDAFLDRLSGASPHPGVSAPDIP
ncbi:MBL fold metallo-hydrolase [Oceanicella sp. SM1341]|uniref:MBL fold metallo-hydrolase n=1 Tax=Oceanicella sp. SM1341 TaxID=1548889 RepID=UPI000E4AA667|nr:MBL fold metallo-hydrolase [Oceanicella sp. SM1341]